MSAIKATVTEVARGFSDYVNRVAYGNEKFILVRGGRSVAELKRCDTNVKLSELPHILAQLPSLSEDEVEAFQNDLKDIHNAVEMETSNPWDA
jgi:antitoxin (DNA-binding transcriptional repressor) of toxin-antitoxin stability system